jgi:hypothetical protein
VTQPAKSRTGLWVAIGGAVVALLLICCAGGVVAYVVLKDRELPAALEPGRPSTSASARGADLQRCVIGSWSYAYDGFTGSLHGSPSLAWKHDKGDLLVTFKENGMMRLENTMELAARDTAGAEHRVRRTGVAEFSYKITGSEITYGPITDVGKSTYFVNGAQQGAPIDRTLWVATPGERIRCTPKGSIAFTGFDDGQPYDQFFDHVGR